LNPSGTGPLARRAGVRFGLTAEATDEVFLMPAGLDAELRHAARSAHALEDPKTNFEGGKEQQAGWQVRG
jgi:hypothetical protein